MLLQALCIISYPLVNSNWSYSPEAPNLGHIWRFLAPYDLKIWRMTFKNNRAPLLSNIKLYVSFHHHMWIQTGVTVRKRLSWVVTSVTLTFDLWPWPFAWTLPFITIHRAAWSQLKRNEASVLFPWPYGVSPPHQSMLCKGCSWGISPSPKYARLASG